LKAVLYVSDFYSPGRSCRTNRIAWRPCHSSAALLLGPQEGHGIWPIEISILQLRFCLGTVGSTS